MSEGNLISRLPQIMRGINNIASCTSLLTCAQVIILNEEGNAPYQTPRNVIYKEVQRILGAICLGN